MLRHGLTKSLTKPSRDRGRQKGVWPETIAAIKAYQITQHKNAVYQASDHHWFTEQGRFAGRS
jgi:predicted Zn-dependent peptidase